MYRLYVNKEKRAEKKELLEMAKLLLEIKSETFNKDVEIKKERKK